MQKNYKLVLLIITLLLISCSKPEISKPGNTTTDLKIVKSKYSDLKFKIPINWNELSKNKLSFFDICITDEDYFNAVYLVPLIINFEINPKNESEKFKKIVYYSILLKEAEYDINIDKKEVEYFEINERKFALYKFSDQNGNAVKIFVFNHSIGPQELTFRRINSQNSENYDFKEDFTEKIILNSIQ